MPPSPLVADMLGIDQAAAKYWSGLRSCCLRRELAVQNRLANMHDSRTNGSLFPVFLDSYVLPICFVLIHKLYKYLGCLALMQAVCRVDDQDKIRLYTPI